MNSLKKHKVYKLPPISSVPTTGQLIGTRFVSKQKADSRSKPRLVVQGHVQEAGMSYGRGYPTVYRVGSVRPLLAVACEHGWPAWHMDVAVACVQSEIVKDECAILASGQDVKDPKTGEVLVYKLGRSPC